MEGLTQYKRRNPFDEYGIEELINVYLRSDVEAKALEVWGSMELINQEKIKRKQEYERMRLQVFNLKKSLKDYHNRIEQMENPFRENNYVRIKTLFIF